MAFAANSVLGVLTEVLVDMSSCAGSALSMHPFLPAPKRYEPLGNWIDQAPVVSVFIEVNRPLVVSDKKTLAPSTQAVAVEVTLPLTVLRVGAAKAIEVVALEVATVVVEPSMPYLGLLAFNV